MINKIKKLFKKDKKSGLNLEGLDEELEKKLGSLSDEQIKNMKITFNAKSPNKNEKEQIINSIKDKKWPFDTDLTDKQRKDIEEFINKDFNIEIKDEKSKKATVELFSTTTVSFIFKNNKLMEENLLKEIQDIEKKYNEKFKINTYHETRTQEQLDKQIETIKKVCEKDFTDSDFFVDYIKDSYDDTTIIVQFKKNKKLEKTFKDFRDKYNIKVSII